MMHLLGKFFFAAALITSMFIHSTEPTIDVETIDDLNLENEYQIANEQDFLGQLPKRVDIKWARLGNSLGESWLNESGAHIRIDRHGNQYPRYVRLTLRHEMCHLKVDLDGAPEFDEHGPKWQGCMVNLALHGAFHDLW
jgi:predicted SprT family Zn-dependent metalloprotease